MTTNKIDHQFITDFKTAINHVTIGMRVNESNAQELLVKFAVSIPELTEYVNKYDNNNNSKQSLSEVFYNDLEIIVRKFAQALWLHAHDHPTESIKWWEQLLAKDAIYEVEMTTISSTESDYWIRFKKHLQGVFADNLGSVVHALDGTENQYNKNVDFYADYIRNKAFIWDGSTILARERGSCRFDEFKIAYLERNSIMYVVDSSEVIDGYYDLNEMIVSHPIFE